eukprot:scaffold66669_cov78-Phaeocystis_antarctica.AAC.5
MGGKEARGAAGGASSACFRLFFVGGESETPKTRTHSCNSSRVVVAVCFQLEAFLATVQVSMCVGARGLDRVRARDRPLHT